MAPYPPNKGLILGMLNVRLILRRATYHFKIIDFFFGGGEGAALVGLWPPRIHYSREDPASVPVPLKQGSVIFVSCFNYRHFFVSIKEKPSLNGI